MSARRRKPQRCDSCGVLAARICSRQVELVGTCLQSSLRVAIYVLNDSPVAQAGYTLGNCIDLTNHFRCLIEAGDFDVNLASDCAADLRAIEDKLEIVERHLHDGASNRGVEIGEIRDCVKVLESLVSHVQAVISETETSMPQAFSHDRAADDKKKAPQKLTPLSIWLIGSFFLVGLLWS